MILRQDNIDILNCKRAEVVATVLHQYLYDNLDRKISVTTTVDGEEIARTATTYDDKGRVATTTMSDVRTDNTNALNYGYLVNGSVKSISTSNGKFEMTLGLHRVCTPPIRVMYRRCRGAEKMV